MVGRVETDFTALKPLGGAIAAVFSVFSLRPCCAAYALVSFSCYSVNGLFGACDIVFALVCSGCSCDVGVDLNLSGEVSLIS
jgi:hypothetical protein